MAPELWCLWRLLRVSWTRRSDQSKGNLIWLIWKDVLNWNANTLSIWCWKSNSLEKTQCWKDWEWEKDDKEWFGWHPSCSMDMCLSKLKDFVVRALWVQSWSYKDFGHDWLTELNSISTDHIWNSGISFLYGKKVKIVCSNYICIYVYLSHFVIQRRNY